MIGCDALPYMIGHRVLVNVHSCPACDSDFLSEEELVEHCLITNHLCDAKQCRKYKNIMLVHGIDFCYLYNYFFVVVVDVAQYYYDFLLFCINFFHSISTY